MTSDSDRSPTSEFELIEEIRRRLPPAPPGQIWSGDDAAVVEIGGTSLVFTTDVVVEGIDFDLTTFSAEDVGWKATMANASDVAAMGAKPRYLVAVLILPGDQGTEVAVEIAEGLSAAAIECGAAVVGGDISRGGELSVGISMLGSLGSAAVLRAGASRGDLLGVTGTLGAAAGGLMLLQGKATAGSAGDELVDRQRRPRARVAEGELLAALGATSMIDISDGFLADLTHLLDASGRGCEVEVDRLPVDPALEKLDGIDPLELALTGGEDFELLFTIPESRFGEAEAALAAMGTRASRIGQVVDSSRRVGDRNLEEWPTKGWDHLRNP